MLPVTEGEAVRPGPLQAPDEPPDLVWTIPNALSLLRLLGVPLFLWLALGPEADGLAVLVLVLGGATDWLDGHLARRWDQLSRLGALLDPLADRLYIVAVVVALVLRDIVPLWFAGALAARDLLLLALVPLLRTRGLTVLPVHYLGKAATFNLLYALPLLLLSDGDGLAATLARPVGWAFALWGGALYWWAGLLYAAQVRRVLASRPAGASSPRGGRTAPG